MWSQYTKYLSKEEQLETKSICVQNNGKISAHVVHAYTEQSKHENLL